jgi:ribosomal protein S18 acetylase RimI-like enzyme
VNIYYNKIRQFGYRATITRLLRAVIRPVVRIRDDIILALPGKRNNTEYIAEILPLSMKVAEDLIKSKRISNGEVNKFNNLLSSGSSGFYADINGNVAGYAFLQRNGNYKFGSGGRFVIPNNMVILKNLYVFPEYRGKSLAKELMKARLAAIPENIIPVVFVAPDNRYTIRNLKSLGFCEFISVRVVTFFGKWTKHRITEVFISKKEWKIITDQLIVGLSNYN